MKIIKKNLKEGSIKVFIDNPEDLWYLSEIVEKNDLARGKCSRKIKIGDNLEKSIKKIFTATISVSNVDYDSKSLRLNGTLTEAPEDIALGSFQSMTIEFGDSLEIKKESWGKLELSKLEESQKQHNDILLVLVDRNDSVLALLKKRGYQTILKLKGESKGKLYETEKAKDFFKEVSENILNVVNSYKCNKVIVGASSFWHDELKKYLHEIIKMIIFVSYTNSGKDKDIEGMFKAKELYRILEDDRTAREIRIVEEALEKLAKRDKIAYGIKEVGEAVKIGAVNTLLVSERLIIESREKGTFKEIEDLMKKVENMQGEVYIISTLHDAGKKLKSLGGILAVLRYNLS